MDKQQLIQSAFNDGLSARQIAQFANIDVAQVYEQLFSANTNDHKVNNVAPVPKRVTEPKRTPEVKHSSFNRAKTTPEAKAQHRSIRKSFFSAEYRDAISAIDNIMEWPGEAAGVTPLPKFDFSVTYEEVQTEANAIIVKHMHQARYSHRQIAYVIQCDSLEVVKHFLTDINNGKYSASFTDSVSLTDAKSANTNPALIEAIIKFDDAGLRRETIARILHMNREAVRNVLSTQRRHHNDEFVYSAASRNLPVDVIDKIMHMHDMRASIIDIALALRVPIPVAIMRYFTIIPIYSRHTDLRPINVLRSGAFNAKTADDTLGRVSRVNSLYNAVSEATSDVVLPFAFDLRRYERGHLARYANPPARASSVANIVKDHMNEITTTSFSTIHEASGLDNGLLVMAAIMDNMGSPAISAINLGQPVGKKVPMNSTALHRKVHPNFVHKSDVAKISELIAEGKTAKQIQSIFSTRVSTILRIYDHNFIRNKQK